MRNWRMLTQLQISISDDSETLIAQRNSTSINKINITKDELIATELEIFIFDHVTVTSIDDSIDKLSNLEIFSLTNHECNDLPWKSLGKLKKLKMFDASYSINLINITDDICNWKDIRYFRMSTTSINYLPNCISNWKQLKRVEIDGCSTLLTIPKQLFQLPQIVTVIAVYTGVTNITFEDNDNWGSNLNRVYLQQLSTTTNALCSNK